MAAGAPLRVGILNLMPRLEAYEPLLLGPLARAGAPVEPVRIRLASHAYGSSDQAHLARHYRTYDEAVAGGELDGLVVTGAPVEELPFEEVRYWPELTAILAHARARVPSTLGLCWGGLALAATLGIPKVLYPRKLFGVYDHARLVEGHPLLAGPARFPCAHSRHAGADDAAVEAAAARGELRLLGHGAEAGHVLFETPDHRLVMHLGHPEYVAARLVFEWERDQALGRDDVAPPVGFDPARPTTPWEAHREGLFGRWVALLAAARGEAVAGRPASLARAAAAGPTAGPSVR